MMGMQEANLTAQNKTTGVSKQISCVQIILEAVCQSLCSRNSSHMEENTYV